MHIFQRELPLKFPGFDFGFDLGHTLLNIRQILGADNLLSS